MNGATVSMFVIGAVIALVIALVVGAEIVSQTTQLTAPSVHPTTKAPVETGTCVKVATATSTADGVLSVDCAKGTLALARTVLEFVPVLYFVGLFAIPAAIGFAAYRKFTQ